MVLLIVYFFGYGLGIDVLKFVIDFVVVLCDLKVVLFDMCDKVV